MNYKLSQIYKALASQGDEQLLDEFIHELDLLADEWTINQGDTFSFPSDREKAEAKNDCADRLREYLEMCHTPSPNQRLW